MRNTLKRTLSLVLAVLMLGSVAATAFAAEQTVITKGMENLEYVMEYFEEDLGEPIPRHTYYFIMPEDWKKESNKWYDGSSLDSCVAGIYWYGATGQPDDYTPFYTKGWPGYAVTTKDEAGVYVASIPADVTTVIWNNTIDGGMDSTLPIYKEARQTEDLSTTGYDGSDPYGFYPEGIPTDPGCDGMVYVIDPSATKINEHSGVTTYGGAWFYYYGNGEYGIAPNKADAFKVFKNGEFPEARLNAKPDSVEIGVGSTETLKINKDTDVKVEVADESIATVTKTDAGYVVEGVAPGETTVTFTAVDENGNTKNYEVTNTPDVDTVKITVTKPYLDKEEITVAAGDIDFIIGYGFSEAAVWTSSNNKVATVDSSGQVTGIGVGTAVITVKQGAQEATCTVTVTSEASISKKSASLKAGQTLTLKINGKNPYSGKVVWSTNNKTVATVKNGKVTALKKGAATITAKVEGKTLTCKVNVTSNPKLSKATASVKKGGKTVITVNGAATKVTVSKCTIATLKVNKNKITVTGKAKGTKKVNVKVNGVTLKLTVKVK